MELDDPALWSSYRAAVALRHPRRVSEGHPPRTVPLRYRYDWGEIEEIDDWPCTRYPIVHGDFDVTIPLPALVRGRTRSDCQTKRNHGYCTDYGPFSLLLWPSDDRILVVGRQYTSLCRFLSVTTHLVAYEMGLAEGDVIALSEMP
jgi:hypothetical protein